MKKITIRLTAVIIFIGILMSWGIRIGLPLKAAEAQQEENQVLEIKTAADLFEISLEENRNKDFILIDNIDLETDASWYSLVGDIENGWLPVDASKNAGTFNGNGKTIQNLWIDERDTEYTGLFSVCSLNVINLNLELKQTDGDWAISGGEIAGAVAAVMNGNLLNVTATGCIQSSYLAGGLVGQALGKIERSCFEGRVLSERAGGLVGNSVSAEISNCYSYADVSGKIVGGLIGIADGGSAGEISDSFAFGTVSNSGADGLTRIGGLIGIRTDGVTVKNLYALIENPCIAQGDNDGSNALTKYEFTKEENFPFDFDSYWYFSIEFMFPQLRHIVVSVASNANTVRGRQILEKEYFYNGEEVTLNLDYGWVSVKSITRNGKELNDELIEGKLKFNVLEYTQIDVEFSFMAEVVQSVAGSGTVKIDKQYYSGGESINFIAEPDKGCTLKSLTVRYNDGSEESLEINNQGETYSYFIKNAVSEEDKIFINAVFTDTDDNSVRWWEIVLYVIASAVSCAGIILLIFILIKNKKSKRKH